MARSTKGKHFAFYWSCIHQYLLQWQCHSVKRL